MVKKWLKTIFVFFSSFLCCQRNNREESDILWEFDPLFFLFSFLSSFRLWFSLPFVCFLWTKFDAKSFFVAFSNLVRIFDWSYLISIGMKLIEHKFKMKKRMHWTMKIDTITHCMHHVHQTVDASIMSFVNHSHWIIFNLHTINDI